MSCGIYKITNKINGKSYIGQSIYIEKRWTREKQEAFCSGSHSYDYILSQAFRKYGLENFSFEILEECPRAELNERERYYISYYDTYHNGYNATLGGDARGACQNKDKILGIINDLSTTNMKHKDIAEKWGMSTEMVQGINTGRYHYQDNISYPIQKTIYNQPKEKKHNYCIDCGVEICKTAIRCNTCHIKRLSYPAITGKPYPTKEELLQLLEETSGNFTAVSKIYQVSDNCIRKWCAKYDLPTHSSDYRPKKERQAKKPQKRQVAQIDNENNVIATFSSITEAGLAVGTINGAHIGDVCRGKRKTAYGYKWKYLEDINK